MGWTIPLRNPEGRAFITVLIVFAVIAVWAFGLRIYSRRLKKASLDASDYTCLLGLVLGVGLVVSLWAAFAHGWGQDITTFTLDDARFSSQAFIIIEIVWNAATVSVRVSMLLLYIRIFAVRWFRTLCWVIVALNITIFISVILGTCLICRPITYSFDKTIAGGSCGDLLQFELYTAISNLIADSITVILPMPMLWRLQMQKKKKVQLSIVLGMGTIICALTLTRCIASTYYAPDNYTKQAALTALITGLEPIIGVINACLPFLPLVFTRIGKTPVFLRVSTALRSITRRTNKSDGSTSILRTDHRGKFSGLTDIKMSPVKNASFGRGYLGIDSHHSICESGPWKESRNHDRILVRNDFSVETN